MAAWPNGLYQLLTNVAKECNFGATGNAAINILPKDQTFATKLPKVFGQGGAALCPYGLVTYSERTQLARQARRRDQTAAFAPKPSCPSNGMGWTWLCQTDGQSFQQAGHGSCGCATWWVRRQPQVGHSSYRRQAVTKALTRRTTARGTGQENATPQQKSARARGVASKSRWLARA